MSSINKATLMGRLGADPEVRRLQNGDPVVSIRLATSEQWKDKNTGEKKERTEWHSVVIFNKPLCDIAEKYLKKGHLVYIEGQLGTRKWQDQSGQDRYTTEIVLRPFNGELKLMPQGNGQGRGAQSSDDYGRMSGASGGGRTQEQSSPGMRDLDDEIPF